MFFFNQNCSILKKYFFLIIIIAFENISVYILKHNDIIQYCLTILTIMCKVMQNILAQVCVNFWGYMILLVTLHMTVSTTVWVSG